MSRILQPAEGESLSDLGFAIQSLATVRGYIRALEDVLRDLEPLFQEEGVGEDWFKALETVKFTTQQWLNEARQTLEKLS